MDLLNICREYSTLSEQKPWTVKAFFDVKIINMPAVHCTPNPRSLLSVNATDSDKNTNQHTGKPEPAGR